MAFEKLDGLLEARIRALVHMNDLPSVLFSEFAPLCRAPHEPDIAMTVRRGTRMAPPPHSQTGLAPQYHDTDL
jgi:hypothetical protein